MSVILFILRSLLLLWALVGAIWPGHSSLAAGFYVLATLAAFVGVFYPKVSFLALALAAAATLVSWGVSVNPGH